MVCIYCGGNTQVTNSRHQKRPNNIWRRRKCTDCGAVITSIERVDLPGALSLKTTSGLQPFVREILFVSVYDSLRHRNTAVTDASGLCDTIVAQLNTYIDNGAIDRDVLVTITAEVLDRFDKAAATHYRAFHP